MNRLFDFSRGQLWVLAVLSVTAALMGAWLMIDSWLLPVEPARPLDVHPGTSAQSKLPEERYHGIFVIDPNTAPMDSLELLPGVGPVKAGRIIRYRAEHRFERAEDIMNVKGIGPRTFEKLEPFLKVPQ